MAAWDNAVSALVGGAVGGIGGFFSRKSNKEKNDLDRLIAAVDSWESYSEKMKNHWETCEVQLQDLRGEFQGLRQELEHVKENCAKLHKGA